MPTDRERRRDEALPLQDQLGKRVHGIAATLAPAQWDAPTNCPPWTVKTIVAHLVRNAELFDTMLDCGLRGEQTFPQTPEQREQRQRELTAMPAADLVDTFETKHQHIRQRFARLSADDLERTCPHPRFMATAWWTVDARVTELAFHTWDIESSLGHDAEIDGAVAQFILPTIIERNLKSFHKPSPASYGRWVLRATDMHDGTWLIEPNDGGVAITRTEADGDVVIAGDNAAICRWLYGRADLEQLEQAGRVSIGGDRDRVSAWKDMFPAP